MNKKNTRQLTDERKNKLLRKHFKLIKMIHDYGDMMLKKQIIQLYNILYKTNENIIHASILELIENGFLQQKQVSFGSNTQILYLSKFARLSFYDYEESGSVPAIKFSERKIYETIMKVDYLINQIIPTMKKLNYEIFDDNLLTYLDYIGSNLFMSSNQIDNSDIYLKVGAALSQEGFTLNEDFERESNAFFIDSLSFRDSQTRENEAREEMESIKSMYTNKVEQNKYCYNLVNMNAHRYFFIGASSDEIKLVYFDSLNTIDINSYYTQLAYIYMMFCRYTNRKDLKLSCTLYTWSMDRKDELEQEEQKKYFNRITQEFSDETKKEHIFQSLGILPSKWEYITSTYKINDLTKKYYLSI